ncbi:unnamed protein product [Mycena citricolor]|uniref:DUF6818 domain-containing protein n=1 Tax=Mycena citricolor TaxID=2018698 RepID=A0AAD2H598_9AGAR|nr:unnamed protein product [Mycena citricolor]
MSFSPTKVDAEAMKQLQQLQFTLNPIATPTSTPSNPAPPIPPTLVSKVPASNASMRRPKPQATEKKLTTTKSTGSKKRTYKSDESDNDNSKSAAKRKSSGRTNGSGNYANDHVMGMLNVVEDVEPAGGNGWKEVARLYNIRAEEEGWPTRTQESLQRKYKSFLTMKKPTGSGERPPHVTRALQIEENIIKKAGIVEISDTDNSSDTDVDVKPVKKRTAVATRAPSPARRRSRVNPNEVMGNVARAFDPEAMERRESAQTQRMHESAQLFAASQQTRDLQREVAALHRRIEQLQERLHEAQRERDMAKLRLEFIQPPRSHANSSPYMPPQITDNDYEFDWGRSSPSVSHHRNAIAGPSHPQRFPSELQTSTVVADAAEVTVSQPDGSALTVTISPSKGKGKQKATEDNEEQ